MVILFASIDTSYILNVYIVDTIGGYMKIHAKIQKWGNGLALRIGGSMREIPQFQEGTEVEVEVTEIGFTVIKAKRKNHFPFKEKELLKELSPEKAHADLLASPLLKEVGQ